MRHKLDQIGVLELTDDEYGTIVDIFGSFPERTLLCSTYIILAYGINHITITDNMFRELIKIRSTPSKEKWFSLIDKILDFRANAIITIK